MLFNVIKQSKIICPLKKLARGQIFHFDGGSSIYMTVQGINGFGIVELETGRYTSFDEIEVSQLEAVLLKQNAPMDLEYVNK
jgi:hypothetical protein